MSKHITKKETVVRRLAKFRERLNYWLDNVTEETEISISAGNTKMGSVPSFSVLPFITCDFSRCKENCFLYCYAAKLADLRTNVLNAYAKNTAMVIKYPESVKKQLDDYFNTHCVKWFRFNVAGDFNLKNYFDIALQLITEHKEITFLSFTKCFEIFNRNYEQIPVNWKVLYSDGDIPGSIVTAENNPHHFPVTVIYNNGEEINPFWLLCGGNCFECACRGVGCWQLKKGEILAFKKH